MGMGPSCGLPQHLASGTHAVNRSSVLPDGEAWHYCGLGVWHILQMGETTYPSSVGWPNLFVGTFFPVQLLLASFPLPVGVRPHLSSLWLLISVLPIGPLFRSKRVLHLDFTPSLVYTRSSKTRLCHTSWGSRTLLLAAHLGVFFMERLCCAWLFIPVWLFVTPWTIACQAPMSVGFSRQEHWSGLHTLLQWIFPTQGSNPCLPYCGQILYWLSPQGSSRILEWVAYPFSRGSSHQDWTQVSCIAHRFYYHLSHQGNP